MKTHGGKVDLSIEIPTPGASIRGVIKNVQKLRKMVDAPMPENEDKRDAWENEVARLRAALRQDETLFKRETLYYRLACCWDGIRRLNAVQSKIGFSLKGSKIAESTRNNLKLQIAEIEGEITVIEDELSLKSRLKRYGENLLMEPPLTAATPEINTPVWGANR